MKKTGPPKPNRAYQRNVIATLARMAEQDNAELGLSVGAAEPTDSPEALAVYAKCRRVLNAVESPIEQRLIFALPLKMFLELRTQIRLGSYRADFGFEEFKIAVECDGHEWHKTQAQRTHDAQRDRVFTFEGWTAIRFTGSEINADPVKCAREVERIYRAAVTQLELKKAN